MPRSISEQVVVITGASSGIGHCAARMFAGRGARVVAAARNIEVLDGLVQQIEQEGGQAIAVQADVSDPEQVAGLAQAALDRFGRIDTWINNAGVSMYATFDKISPDEARRIMDVNFMGTFNGMQAALPIMRAQRGGTIINTASVTGKRAIPLQSVYSASKYAIVGLGEALRAELANEEAEINVCTICPPSIDTPFFDNAKTKEGYAPRPMPPVYQPETVAEAMVACAEDPRREVLIGSAGKAFALFNTLAPGVTDWFLGKTAINGQLTNEPKPAAAAHNLYDSAADGREHGGWTGLGTRQGVAGSEMARLAGRHPLATAGLAIAAIVIAARYALR
jgi:short-subunit dehydrogenase